MGNRREGLNEYGTPITVIDCDTCGHEFSVCPADTEGTFGDDCVGPGCASYDVLRDMDIYFDALSEAGQIQRTTRGGDDRG